MKTKQFKALLKKDYLVYKKILFLPIWITLGFYLINLISLATAYFRGDIHANFLTINGNIPKELLNFNNPIASYIGNYAAVFMPTILCGLVLIYLAQKAMNEDRTLQFSFFHRSQPVDEKLIIASKTVVIVGGLWISTIVLSLINFVIVNVVLEKYFNLFNAYSFLGYIQSLGIVLLSYIFIGSLLILCSAIFKKAAFLKLISSLVLLKILFSIFEKVYHWNFPNVFMKILNPVIIPFKYLFTEDLEYMNIKDVVEHVNANIFSLNTLLILAFSFAFLVGTFYIYKNSEIAN